VRETFYTTNKNKKKKKEKPFFLDNPSPEKIENAVCLNND